MRTLALLPLLAVFAVGCGGKPPPPPPPVDISGKVVDAAGKPVGDKMLSLAPADPANQGERPLCQVQADGTFRVTCIPGKYKATLVAMPKMPGHGPGEGGTIMPDQTPVGRGAKGGTPTQPSWDIEVKASGNDEFKLVVPK